MDVISFEDKSPIAYVPFSLAYSFDYARFDKPDLQAKAKSTLGNL